jgi:D-glycero-D-manno-heptose 1,7-bisphosphate phosphatase
MGGRAQQTKKPAPCIILDRDGVINHDSDDYIKSPNEWQPIAGSLEAIARLTKANIKVLVATNQSGIARGLYDEGTLAKIHAKMTRLIVEKGGQLGGIFYCPHGPDDGCNCRKPLPGLVHQISDKLAIDPTNVPFVGDSVRDLVAAEAAGCQPILVKTGKGERSLASGKVGKHITVFNDLASFVDYWLTTMKNAENTNAAK